MLELFQADVEKRGIILDPRTKLFAMLTIVLFVIGGSGIISNWMINILALFPLLLLCTVKKWRKALIYGFVFVIALCLLYFTDSIHAGWGYLIIMTCVIVTRILPGLIMGAYIFSSTTVSEFITAMRKMHVSNKIAIPMSVMFRFFPTVIEEFFSINSAMKMRDIRIGGENIGKMVEYRLVPLMVCSVNIGNELSAAALTRGLSADSKRTNICKIGFHLQDILIIMIMLVPYVLAVLRKAGAIL
ncbi:MAG: energy-coupling factor transporter transmembrane component T [Lachnospiraceae bacterium]